MEQTLLELRDKSTSIDLKMSQSKQGNRGERDIQPRSAYYKAGRGKEGLLVEERAGARPQVGHDLACLQKGSVAGTETEWERGSQEDRDKDTREPRQRGSELAFRLGELGGPWGVPSRGISRLER